MRLLFTKSTKPLSKLIRDVTEEPVSHVALEFPQWNIVVQANLRGLHIEWARHFRQECEVVYELERVSPLDFMQLDKLLKQYEFSLYDFGGLLFLGATFALRKYFKLPLAKANLWHSTGMFICTTWVQTYLDMTVDDMITPYKLYEKLKATGDWNSDKK